MANTRKTAVIILVALLAVGLAAWWASDFSLDFMRFFAAEPGPTGPLDTEEPSTTREPQMTRQPTEAVRCGPLTQTVAVGATATVNASGGEGVYRWFAVGANDRRLDTGGEIGEGAQIQLTYASPGTKKVTVLAMRSGGEAEDTAVCTVIVTP